ncbi:hypothetical protein [Kiloniella litopenaei]|uniref:hypothetical protein n=1 Tax=Kiloniella litopenaei TaxID=1549748 RepID=UPI003BAB660A
MSEDLGTLERRAKGGLTIKNHHDHKGFVVGKGAAVEFPTLIELLYENGFLGCGDKAKRRKEAGLMLTDLMERVYRSEGVAGYSIVTTSEHEMSDEEANDRAKLNKIMRPINLCHWRLIKRMCHDHEKDNVEFLAQNMIGEPQGYQAALDRLADVMGIG